jgi:hypothetical protein
MPRLVAYGLGHSTHKAIQDRVDADPGGGSGADDRRSHVPRARTSITGSTSGYKLGWTCNAVVWDLPLTFCLEQVRQIDRL